MRPMHYGLVATHTETQQIMTNNVTELLATLKRAHETALANFGEEPDFNGIGLGGAPADFAHLAEEEYYLEPWSRDLRSTVASYLFCTYVQTGRTVRGKRVKKPHRTSVHVCIGRRQNVEQAALVSALLSDAIRSLARDKSKGEGLEDPRASERGHKAKLAEEVTAKVHEMHVDAMKEAWTAAVYGTEARYAVKYVASMLAPRVEYDPKKLKVVPIRSAEIAAIAA